LATVKQKPYQSLAGIYDFVMRHVDYESWTAYIRDLLTRFEHRPQSLVDLACGTGNIALELRALGYFVTAGVDSSESMLQVAREKAAGAGTDIDFVQRDLRQLTGLGPFDTAVCMYDSFNYLLTLDDLGQALREVCGILHPHGLFIFDICTEQNSQRYFKDIRDREQGTGFSYERHSYYDERERLQFNHFTLRFAAQDALLEETHIQRIYPLAEIVERIEASPLDFLGAFDGFTFNQGSERSDRVHFALRRPEA